MAELTGHPDDELLFDFTAGSLDSARADEIRAHVARCAGCAAFMDAALIGADATSLLVEPMPTAAAAALDAAVDAAWRERAVVSNVATAPPALVRTPTPRRARRFVPILAFAALALLAGASIYAGRGGGDSSSYSSSPKSQSETSTDAPATSERTPAVEADSSAGAPAMATPPAPPIDSGDVTGDAATQRECIATRDETQLFLPDGRVAQVILTGPLGIYVVCG